MVSGSKTEASIDSAHARTELLSFRSSSVPHDRLLTFCDMRREQALPRACLLSAVRLSCLPYPWEEGPERGTLCQQTGLKRSVPLSVLKTWETESSRLVGSSENHAGLNSNTIQGLPTFFQDKLNHWGN